MDRSFILSNFFILNYIKNFFKKKKGVSFAKNETNNKISSIMIAIFSASGPIGIALGWVISNSNEIVEAVFLAISAGKETFLHFLQISIN